MFDMGLAEIEVMYDGDRVDFSEIFGRVMDGMNIYIYRTE